MEQHVVEKAKKWLSNTFDEDTRKEVRQLINENSEELVNAFYKDLEFGTGGLRGIMGAGTNKINIYTIGITTQGLANYLMKCFSNEQIKVAIACDSRNNSRLFADTSANILSANGITVYLFESLRPTPELSFTVRHLGCHSGIVITASHNPPEYNGYKAYWKDGGQLVPPHDQNIIDEVQKVDIEDLNFEGDPSLIKVIGADLDNAYLQKVQELCFQSGEKDLKIVYTPIHGAGYRLIPKALNLAGYNRVTVVEEQATPDGNFPTVKSPNPEEADALYMGIEKAKEIDADILLGTDPDSDRVGMAVKDDDAKWVLVNGHQAGTMLIYYLANQWKDHGKLDGKQYICKTIVTTELVRDIANAYGIKCIDTLTGFKWIAEQLRLRNDQQFIGGGEESYGYLVGDFVRDKDAVISSVQLCEAAEWARQQGSTFWGILLQIYQEFGLYYDRLISITRKGKSGAEEIALMMDGYRNDPPANLGGSPVIQCIDYQVDETGLPKSNVLQFFTADESKITARPSGTEPKIKFYISVKGQLTDRSEYEKQKSMLEEKIDEILIDLSL